MQAQSETMTADTAAPATFLETHFGNEQPVVTVPYSSLRPSPLNARTRPLSGIPGLAANIRAKDLLQNLVVHEIKGARGRQRKYGVCAGQRREAALDLLFEQKDIAADYPVTAHRTVAIHAEMVAQPAVALAALLRHLIPQALPEHYGYTSAPDYLALSGDNNQDSLLRAADDLPTCPAWNAIEAQRARWVAELPAKPADLLPWLAKQDPGTTLLDLLAFCTGTLLDGIVGEEKPQAISALAGALHLDMTRYWTPTRATYFDHVSKARIGDVVSAAVSPKVAADLGKMKKTDAAAAAELRLAKVAWLPEILTDTEIPVTPSWEAHDDDDGDAGTDEHGSDTGNGTDDAQEDDDAAAEPGSDHSGINNTACDVPVSPAAAGTQPPWPFPTAAGLEHAS
ncbi:ParB/Srx family N-terminal domain-containing protein [Burkholderia cenocepacia]|uniref:ParB/Srx family N-terminal domain-containing protein n=1 Tax=Burkholderia cenocepacia TaxID=95486 RepID=UPI0015885C3D|nr:ParB/Srx family N-terminal domain-containing protein [Burkholderia cenocepacia]